MEMQLIKKLKSAKLLLSIIAIFFVTFMYYSFDRQINGISISFMSWYEHRESEKMLSVQDIEINLKSENTKQIHFSELAQAISDLTEKRIKLFNAYVISIVGLIGGFTLGNVLSKKLNQAKEAVSQRSF